MRRTGRIHSILIWLFLILILILVSTNLKFFLYNGNINITTFQGSSNEKFIIETLPQSLGTQNHTVVAICRPDWIGIKTATLAQNLTTLLIREYNTDRNRHQLLDLIQQNKVASVSLIAIMQITNASNLPGTQDHHQRDTARV